MNKIIISFCVGMAFSTLIYSQNNNESDVKADTISNESYPKAIVSYSFYDSLVNEVSAYRKNRLISLDAFLTKKEEENCVILDTRSKEMYDRKHVKGAIHLNFSDFTQFNLDQIMSEYAGRNTQILIYCNNNFADPIKPNLQDPAFVSKVALPVFEDEASINPTLMSGNSLALNIPTFINLYGYGYRNIFELDELVYTNDPRIEFEGTDVELSK